MATPAVCDTCRACFASALRHSEGRLIYPERDYIKVEEGYHVEYVTWDAATKRGCPICCFIKEHMPSRILEILSTKERTEAVLGNQTLFQTHSVFRAESGENYPREVWIFLYVEDRSFPDLPLLDWDGLKFRVGPASKYN